VNVVERQSNGVGRLVRDRLLHHGAYRWYLGTIFGLAYQAFEIVAVWTDGRSTGIHVVATVLLGLFYLGFLVIPPLVWAESVRTRIVWLTGYWVASFALLPLVGADIVWVWPLVAAMLCFSWLPTIALLVMTGAIILAQLVIAATTGFSEGYVFAPLVTASVAVSLFGLIRQIMANQALRRANTEIARLAVADERARFSRDLHDILGHSLTVVAVKSELAGRLVELDPQKAIAEIRDIEQLARKALADLRSTVSSYRELSLATELASARTALAAANIEAHVPLDADTVAPELRPVFGWVVREGVTNVIRHSRANSCWIELRADGMTIRDDGVGDGHVTADGKRLDPVRGNGLRGLGERTHAAGLRLVATAPEHGGFELVVARGAA
jgi:two-component system sensor histidine kinase DesK